MAARKRAQCWSCATVCSKIIQKQANLQDSNWRPFHPAPEQLVCKSREPNIKYFYGKQICSVIHQFLLSPTLVGNQTAVKFSSPVPLPPDKLTTTDRVRHLLCCRCNIISNLNCCNPLNRDPHDTKDKAGETDQGMTNGKDHFLT